MVQDIVCIWCVRAQKLCVVEDSQVKIWICTLYYKNSHLTCLCLPHYFGTILTIFWKFKYYFDFDKSTITLQPSRNEDLCLLNIVIEKVSRTSASLIWEISSSWMSFHVFPYRYLICYFFIWWKEVHQQLKTYHKLTGLFLVDSFLL